MDTIKIKGLTFEKYISSWEISKVVDNLSEQINNDYHNKNVTFIVMLNGAFMFAADLFKRFDGPCKISFIKYSSYKGEKTSGNVNKLIGLNEDLKGKDIVIVEDIVDTGVTMSNLLKDIESLQPKSVEIATLLFKPGHFQGNYNIKYIGMEIDNAFIVGYGFDLDGYGRNFKDIYQKQ